MKRVVIIGNNGSGKTFLAKRMSAPTGVPVINLDERFESMAISGEEGSVDRCRAEIEEIKQGEAWIVEGVSGELAQLFLDRADYLIWLDLPWLTCREGLLSRNLQTPGQAEPAVAGENFRSLLARAEDYWNRTDHRSYTGHFAIFEQFPGAKDRIVFHGCAEALYDD